MARPREHIVTVSINGKEITDFLDYQIDTSLVEPASSFQMTRVVSRDAWDLCRRDAYVRVLIDGQPRMSGFIDKRVHSAAAGEMTISGRDRVGRMVQESAPRSAYGGTTAKAVLEALASPWFGGNGRDGVALSNELNRRVTLGKGSKAPSSRESVSLAKGKRSTKDIDPIKALFAKSKGNRIDPGQSRWEVFDQTVSRMGLAAWATADGKQIFVGKPNHAQPATFLFRHALRGQSTVVDLVYEEDNTDRFSMITAVGSGTSSEVDYGATSRSGTVYDHPANPVDGTGRDFLFPKRLVLPEHSARDHAEAERLALRDQQRRDFRRTTCSVTCWHHGQIVTGSTRTLFALDTIARVIDEPIGVDVDMLIYAASFRCDREIGEMTDMQLVPRGTEIVT